MQVEFDVFHDGRFWVGVLTLTEGDGVRACRVVFGAEPSDPELHDYLLTNGYTLLERAEASPPAPGGLRSKTIGSPKRAARAAAAQSRRPGDATGAQEAIRLAQEASGKHRAEDRRRSVNELAERKRLLRRAKANDKNRGH